MVKRAHDIAFVSAGVVRRTYDISEKTLRVWADGGVLRHVRFNKNGKRLYNIEHLRQLLGDKSEADAVPKRKIIYARVSSAAQREDLERQREDLKQAFPTHKVDF